MPKKNPNNKVHSPAALRDKYGNFVTNPEGIKSLCHEEIVERLRHRKIHSNLQDLQTLKEKLSQVCEAYQECTMD